MPAATAARPVALLRGALLLAGLVAVVLGLLGMHVLAGSHGMHVQAASSGSTALSTGLHSDGQMHTASAHETHGNHTSNVRVSTRVPNATGTAHAKPSVPPVSVTPASVTIGGTEVPPSCVCEDGCAEKPTVHSGCTPSPAGASLSAPQPGSTFLDSGTWTASRADRPAGYAYLPGTPTPRDLSISRT
ncbi:hypothetical protein AB4Y67_07680 [Arthrobacter sp. YAF17]|uniref:hypothetical protein n=1 Tax=Arthrobacter sp. YAF17 TaxID=3233077 RepID=UPI003F92360D